MTDKPMIDSEMITAGAIRQSMDNGERCPKCGEKCIDWSPGFSAFRCGTVSADDVIHDGPDCLRNQLAQAQERERATLAREAQLRRVVEAAWDVWLQRADSGEWGRVVTSEKAMERLGEALAQLKAPLSRAHTPTWVIHDL